MRPKMYSHLKDDNENKKAQKTVSSNENLNLKIINIVQEQLKKKLDVDSLRENQKEFMEYQQMISKLH